MWTTEKLKGEMLMITMRTMTHPAIEFMQELRRKHPESFQAYAAADLIEKYYMALREIERCDTAAKAIKIAKKALKEKDY